MSTLSNDNTSLPSHASVVVIGGGAIGCSTLYHLAKYGISDVVLLEKDKISSGTTWHSAAQVRALRSSRNLTELIKYSIRLYKNLEIETGQSIGWINKGSLSIACNEDRLIHIKRQENLAKLFGIKTDFITREEAKNIWPLMNSSDVIGAVWSPEDGRVSPSDLCNSLIKGAKKNGAKVFEKCIVLNTLTRSGNIYAVETNKGLIKTEKVVICSGLWSKKIAKNSGFDIPIWPCEHYYLLTQGLKEITQNLPTLSDHDSHLYIRDDSGGLLVGCFEPNAKPINPEVLGEDFSFQLLQEDWDHFEPMMRNAMHRLPILENAPVKMLLNGPESFTPDGNFLLGEVSNQKGLFINAGLNSVGIASAGGAGMALSKMIINGRTPFDLHELDPKRFDPVFCDIGILSKRVPEVLGKHYEISYPGRQWKSSRNLKQMPLHNKWKKMGAYFGQFNAIERPLFFNLKGCPKLTFGRPDWFNLVKDEVHYTQKSAGIIDLSSFGKIEIKGPDSLSFIKSICVANFDKPDGSIIYSLILNEEGGIESDLVVFKIDDFNFRIQISISIFYKIKSYFYDKLNPSFNVEIIDITEQYSVIGVFGPNTTNLVKEIPGLDWINDLNYFKFGFGQFLDIEVMVARLSFLGEAGWELSCRKNDIEKIVNLLIKKNIKPIGLFAQTSMRIEKKFLSYGHDFDSDTTPSMVFPNKYIQLLKKSKTINDLKLKKLALNTSKKKLVSLVFEEQNCFPIGNETVQYENKIIGITTSAAFGFRINKPVALAMINFHHYKNFNQVEVNIGQNIFFAQVIEGAVYDPNGDKMINY